MRTDVRSNQLIEAGSRKNTKQAMMGAGGQQDTLFLDGSAQAFFW